MIKTLIADDEQHGIERLRDLLQDHPEFEILAQAQNGTEALEKIVELKPDVAFLDINMPGVSVFRSIASLSDPPIIVFQTAHSKYAAEAFNLNALDYVTKPISTERFNQALEKIKKELSQEQASTELEKEAKPTKEGEEKITLKVGNRIKIIEVNEIVKICFEEGLGFVYTHEGRYLTDRSLNHYEEKFKEMGFFRCSRANLVNLDFVSTIHKGIKGSCFIELKDGAKLELSRRKAMMLKKILDY